MAYFDNAATSYPKPDEVYAFMDSFYRNYGGNAGRGSYSMAKTAKGVIDETRFLLCELLHCPAKQVVFTSSATIALNMIIQGVISKGVRSVYISPFEHNAVTRILHHYEEIGRITVTELAISNLFEYNIERIKYQFDAIRPELVIVSHASNVTGLIAPVKEIFALSKSYNAINIVDMAQTAGLVDLNVGLETIDFAVFAGHKSLFGPTGIAGFVMKHEFVLPPLLFGGTGYDSANQNMPDSIPEKYEMGTLNIAGIAGLNAALKWIKQQTVPRLFADEQNKRNRLLALIQSYPFLKTIGIVDSREYVGIVSCLMDGMSSDTIGGVFSERGVAVRTGLQCAPRAHRFLGTYPAGTIRFSVNALTEEKDFKELEDALDDIRDSL